MRRKKRKVKIRAKKRSQKPALTSSPVLFAPTKIKVVGIGGGGTSIVAEISKSLTRASFAAADTDWRSLKKNSGIQRLPFGQNLTFGLGTGMNWELARQAAENEKEKIGKLFKGQDISILVASLGGGVGSGAAPVFAQMAQQSKCLTLGIFTLPFKFEGVQKTALAKKAFESAKAHLNAAIAIPNERIFKVIDAKTPISSALSTVNKSLIESLQSLIEIIYNPGLINIDFADIRTILKEKNKLAFLNTAQSSGKNASEEITKKILHNPLYNYNLNPEKILFNIAAGSNLSMLDVEKISRIVADSAPRAKIIFGISRGPKAKNKIKATIFATGDSLFAQKPPKPKTKKKEKPVSKKERKAPKKIKKAVKLGAVKTSEKSSEKKKKIKIRRSAVEIKKAEEKEQQEKLLQESELEIPTFLRKIKF